MHWYCSILHKTQIYSNVEQHERKYGNYWHLLKWLDLISQCQRLNRASVVGEIHRLCPLCHLFESHQPQFPGLHSTMCCNECFSFKVKFWGKSESPLSFLQQVGFQYRGMWCAGMCSPGQQQAKRWWNQRSRRMPGNEWNGAFQSFLSPLSSFFSSLYLPPYSHGYKQPVWSGFRFVCCWSHHRQLIVLPLNLSLVFSRSLCLFSFFRKCWTSAKTEEAVKSLSTAACLGRTSVLAAVNTSLSGTNADLVSPSSPWLLTATHIYPGLCLGHSFSALTHLHI